MPMFLWDGPPQYAGGQGVNGIISEYIADFEDPIQVAATQSSVVTWWQPLPDISFTQGTASTYDVSGYVSNSAGLPMGIVLTSGSPPSGVTFDAANQRFSYNGTAPIDSASGLVLRATTGSNAAIPDSFGVFTDAVTATANQPTVTGARGTITEVMPAFVDSVHATATQGPQPSGTRYPNRDFTPTYQEYAFSDVADPAGLHALGANARHSFQIRSYAYPSIFGANPSPGFYQYEANAPTQWAHVGGDWADSSGVAQGSQAFISTDVTAQGTGTDFEVTFNIQTLVQGWLLGTWPNAGLRMAGSNTNTIQWRSRWYSDTSKRPFLRLTSTSLGTVDVVCRRNIWINTSGDTTQAGNTQFQTSGAVNFGLLWFDLSTYTAADITAAVLHCWGFGFGTQSQTVKIFRNVNPGDSATIADIQLGVAAFYPNDVGIEADPNVLFVNKFNSGDVDSEWMCGTNGSGAVLMTAADSNGFAPLLGLYNGAKATTHITTPVSGTNTAMEAHWSTWRGYGQRLKPKDSQPPEELYVRYYMTWGLDWDPSPDGGKQTGFDGRFCQLTPLFGLPTDEICPLLPGMGRGNSGSGTDGLTGWSTRCNYGRYKTATVFGGVDDDPLWECRGIGSGDMYHADMTNTFGGDFGWNNNLLGTMRKGEWNCIEFYTKMNSVTDDTEIPKQIFSIYNNGGVATITLMQPCLDSRFVAGSLIHIGGLRAFPSDAYNNFQFGPYGNGQHQIVSIIDPQNFTINVAASTSSPGTNSGGGPAGNNTSYLCFCFSDGNYDGVVRGWVNGRLAGEYTKLRFRHTKYQFDGHVLGIDNVWFTSYQGGGAPPGPAGWPDYSQYFANFIVARNYIGPIVTP